MAIEIPSVHPPATENPLEGCDLQKDEPVVISCSMSDDGVKVCDICGDTGYDEMLARCSKCNEGAEHVYCMQTILASVPLNWICESCKMRKSIDCPKKVNLRCDSQEETFESIYLGCFDRQNSIESSKCLSSCISEQGTEILERAEMAKHTLSLCAYKKRLSNAPSNSPISKKLAVQSVSLASQPTSLISKPALSREYSHKSSDSKKVKFLSPSALASLSTGGQSPRANKAARKNALLVYPSSPRIGSEKSMHVLSKPSFPSPNSLGKEAYGCALHSMNNSALALHQKSLSKKAAASLHKSISPKFDEVVPSFLLPSKPSNMLRSNKEATVTKVTVVNAAAVTKTSNLVIPSNVLNPAVSKLKTGPSTAKLTIHKPAAFENGKENSVNLGTALKGSGDIDTNSTVSEFSANVQMACIEPSQGGLSKGCHREPEGLQKDGSLEGLEPSIGSSKWHDCKKMGNSSLACSKVRPSKIPEVASMGGSEGQKVSSNTVSQGQYGTSLMKQPQSQASLCCKTLEKWPHAEQLKTKSYFESKVAKSFSNLDGIPTLSHQFVSQDIHNPSSCMEAAIHSRASVISTYPAPQDSSVKKSYVLSGNDQRQDHLDENYLKWKCDLGNQYFQSPIVRQVKGVESVVHSQPTQSPTGNVHSKTLISYVERESTSGKPSCPENSLVLENAPGFGAMPQPCMTLNIRHSAQFPNYELETPALPMAAFVWQGSIQVSSNGSIVGSYYGIQAYPSTQADPKMYESMLSFPSQLEAEELQQTAGNNSWPISFDEKSPDSNSIAIFLLASESHKESYQQLLNHMIAADLALRICLESAQLLIFPSKLLPETVQFTLKTGSSGMCLCGIFLANKAAVLSHQAVRPTLTNIRQPGSGKNACDIHQMEVDMIGAREVTLSEGLRRVSFPGSKGKKKYTCMPSEAHYSTHYHQSQSSFSSDSAATEVDQASLNMVKQSEMPNRRSTNKTDVPENGEALTDLEGTDKIENFFDVKSSNNSTKSKLTKERDPIVQVQDSEPKFGQERINAFCVISDVKDCNVDECTAISYDQECESIVGKTSTISSLWDISTQFPTQPVNCLTLFPDGKASEESNTMVTIINDDKKSKMGFQREEQRFFLKSFPFTESLERFSCDASKPDLEAGSSINPHSVSEDGTFDVCTHLTLALPHHRKSGNYWGRHEDDQTLSCDDHIDFSLSLGVKSLAK